MEVPKNTTQIGEIHSDYKIFIEDYVISYIKQLCRQKPDRKKRIAFYGVMRTEEPQQYFFIYGGSEVKRYGRNDIYLTTQDYEEITWAGGTYFEEYVPLGFVTVEEELPEGIYLFLAGKEVYVQGYHIFYEKNDSMLTFLIHRQNEKDEAFRRENLQYEELKQENLQQENSQQEGMQEKLLQEERRSVTWPERNRQLKREAEAPSGEMKLFGIVKSAAAALLIVLCVTAISTVNGLGKMEGFQNFFGQAVQTMTEKKLPDKENGTLAVSGESVAEENGRDKAEEQEKPEEQTKQEEPDQSENREKEQTVGLPEESTAEIPAEDTVATELPTSAAPEQEPELESVVAKVQTHTVRKGETLISISKVYYGDENHVQAICELNGITNSDNIQIGQKIILP